MAVQLQGSAGQVFGPSGANHSQGLVPDPGSTAGTSRFLREDATWDNPSYVLLNTLTASTSNSLSDTTSLTNANFTVFELVFLQLVPTTSAVAFALQVHSSAAFQTSSYQSNVQGLYNNTASNSASGGTDILLSQVNVGTGAAGLNGSLRIYNPAAGNAAWIGQAVYPNTTGPYLESVVLTGLWTGGSTAIDGFRVFSGTIGTNTIASGTLKVYGII